MAVGPKCGTTPPDAAHIDSQPLLIIPVVAKETVIKDTQTPRVQVVQDSPSSVCDVIDDVTPVSDHASSMTYDALALPGADQSAGEEEQDEGEAAALGALHQCRWERCSATLATLLELVNHVNDAHVKLDGDAEYRCQWNGCPRNGRGFNARYKMLIHVRTHTNEKPHECALCGKRFSRLENLKIHNRTHTGEKPYACPFAGCHKAYSNSSDRFKHVRTHQTDRPYWCKMPGCSKHYTDPSSLRKHIRTNGHHYSKASPLSVSANRRSAGKKSSASSGISTNHVSTCTRASSTASPTLHGVSLAYLLSSVPGSNRIFQCSPSPLSPSSGLVSTTGVTSRHISDLSSNPLLSSTVVTPSESKAKDEQRCLPSASERNSHSVSPQPLLLEQSGKNGFLLSSSEAADLVESTAAKIQEGPLDLSTSPTSGSPTVCIVTEMEEVELVVQDGIVQDPIRWEWQVVQPD